jgi:hypothetical protein
MGFWSWEKRIAEGSLAIGLQKDLANIEQSPVICFDTGTAIRAVVNSVKFSRLRLPSGLGRDRHAFTAANAGLNHEAPVTIGRG